MDKYKNPELQIRKNREITAIYILGASIIPAAEPRIITHRK